MTDNEFVALALTHRAAKSVANAEKAKADELQDRLLAEIERRGCVATTSKGNLVPGFSANGVKILRLAQLVTVYDVAAARARFTPGMMRRLTERVITRDKVEAALAKGLLDAADVEAIKTVTANGAYVRTFGNPS